MAIWSRALPGSRIWYVEQQGLLIELGRNLIMPSNPSTNSLRFLIVDDHAAFRLILRQWVESHLHWSVLAEARDGREATQLAQAYRPDVILMDVIMPIMNGIEATSQIHQQAPNSRIVLFSASYEEEFVLAGIQAGAAGLIWKGQLCEINLEEIVNS